MGSQTPTNHDQLFEALDDALAYLRQLPLDDEGYEVEKALKEALEGHAVAFRLRKQYLHASYGVCGRYGDRNYVSDDGEDDE